MSDTLEESRKLQIRRFRFAQKIGLQIRIGKLENLGEQVLFGRAELGIFVIDKALENSIEFAHPAAASPTQFRKLLIH